MTKDSNVPLPRASQFDDNRVAEVNARMNPAVARITAEMRTAASCPDRDEHGFLFGVLLPVGQVSIREQYGIIYCR